MTNEHMAFNIFFIFFFLLRKAKNPFWIKENLEKARKRNDIQLSWRRRRYWVKVSPRQPYGHTAKNFLASIFVQGNKTTSLQK